MNLPLTDEEFVDHCLKHSDDPNVLRMAKILDRHYVALEGLKRHIDLNDYMEVDDACQFVHIVDYVERLVQDRADARDEIVTLQESVDDLTSQIYNLKNRTLIEMVVDYQEAWDQERDELQASAAKERAAAIRERDRAQQERARAEHLAHQLGMWDILKTEFDK